MTEDYKYGFGDESRIIEEGKILGFSVSQGEWNRDRGEIIVEHEYEEFFECYKIEGFNWKTVIEDFGRSAYKEGGNDVPYW